MKVAVSLPDPVFNAAERLASQLKLPRSQLYAQALAEYLDSHGADVITRQLDAVYAQESSALDVGLKQAQSRSIADETW
jgi:predicted transcriptional regulator